ncbi:hypothetical protein Tco_0265217 [Tanacetum coccineum]
MIVFVCEFSSISYARLDVILGMDRSLCYEGHVPWFPHGCYMFSASVMGQSLESREIEIGIELNPGAELSQSSVRMEPVDLKQVAFLGHIVSADGITMDPSKVEAITKWQRHLLDDRRSKKHQRVTTVVVGYCAGMVMTVKLTEFVLMMTVVDVVDVQAIFENQYFGGTGIKQDVASLYPNVWTFQQTLEIPMWKMDEISMRFRYDLLILRKDMHAIWVVVCRLKQICHFLPIRKNFCIKASGTRLSSVQHFISNEVCQRDHSGLCKICGGLVPLEMKIGEQLFARDVVGERLIEESRSLSSITNEKVAVAKEKLKEARSRQKSYADKHRRELEFQVGDRVFLKVSPFRGVKRFGIKGKLSPRFIVPFEILERIGEVS